MYDKISVTATRKEQYADYVIRTFLLKMVSFNHIWLEKKKKQNVKPKNITESGLFE